jgi:hypothetical protein
MKDDELETMLRRYQVGEPPVTLRARVLDRAAMDRRVRLGAFDLALAAAAAILLISWAATGTAGLVAQQTPAAEAARREAVRQLAIELGPGQRSLMIAEAAVPAVGRVDTLAGLENPW